MQTLPVIPLRGIVVLPGEVIHCDAGRKKTLSAMQSAASGDGYAFFTAQKDAQKVEIAPHDMYTVGTICKIKQVFRIHGEGLHMLVTGVSRGRIKEFTSRSPHFEAVVFDLPEVDGAPPIVEAMRRRVVECFEEYCKFNPGRITSDQKQDILSLTNVSELTYAVTRHTVQGVEDRQRILKEDEIEARMLCLEQLLAREIEVLKVDQMLALKVKQRLEKNQQDYILREKIKVIRKELGDDGEDEADAYTRRMNEKELPDNVKERLEKEIKRLRSLPTGSHERPSTENYIQCVLDLPWKEESETNIDTLHAKDVLDKDHYGMQKVKERIIEYLAVQKLTGKPNGQILCLAGPPGVGKTSIASAIAEATGRNFVRMSLGGVHDEAEIRGHRRTYIGAMPGRIIAAMRQAKSINPVLLFDEIDKLGKDHRGDPTSAMLEVLDSAQNFEFRDHFLELPYDLSKTMILTTANNVDAIPGPLRDRMEILNVPSYLLDEKVQIAKLHLLPRQIEKNGLKRSSIRISDEQLEEVIDGYTREAGVRTLDRTLSKICRKAALEVVEGKKRVSISKKKIAQYLGDVRFKRDLVQKAPLVGVVTGLAWTSVGGDTLQVEASTAVGKGNLKLTGRLGDVMKESGQAAMTYIRAHAAELGLDANFYEKVDIHVHVPEGAVPKDGPSAGITMTVAIISALTGIRVKPFVAMTGEVTLVGRVLKIGGLREKLLAALRAGVQTVLLPEENRSSLSDVPEHVLESLDIRFVSHIDEVLNIVLESVPIRIVEPGDAGAFIPNVQESIRCDGV